MADDDQYCLKWNNHQSTLLSVLTNLMDSERLADCILFTEGKVIKAHQVVLSACSPYLEKLLNDSRVSPGGMPILIFSDLTYDELSSMKEYMYRGEVNIRQENLESFLKAATSLQIKGLTDGGGGDEGGGQGKGKPEPPPDPGRRRKRRESRESDAASHEEEPPKIQKKQQVFSSKIEPFDPQKNGQTVKIEPVMMESPPVHHVQAVVAPPPMIMKPEPAEHEPETHDLTGMDDDEYEEYDMPGPSQSDLSQDMSNWQMDNSMNSEDFSASQSVMNASQPGQSSQDDSKHTFECGKTFDSIFLNHHQRKECSAERVYKSPQYPFKASPNDLLNSHMEANHEQRVYACQLCHFEVSSEPNLKKHISMVHLRDKDMYFRCQHCDYKTRRNDHLKRHISEIHKKLFFCCPYCSFMNKRKEKLKEHMLVKHKTELTVNVKVPSVLNPVVPVSVFKVTEVHLEQESNQGLVISQVQQCNVINLEDSNSLGLDIEIKDEINGSIIIPSQSDKKI